MSVLSACQDAATEMSQTPPAVVFGSNTPFARELALQARRTAEAISEAFDWQALTALGTITGDGSTIGHALPTDFDRMPKKARVHAASLSTRAFRPARDLDDWLYQNDHPASGFPGNWIILGGTFQIFPTLASAVTARFYYLRNTIVRAADLSLKTAFTADTDSFVLSERLLALGIVWRWRAAKGVNYEVELRNYEIALMEAIGTDRGAKAITVGRVRMPASVLAYDGVLGGPGGRTFDSTDEPTFDEE